MRLAAIGISIAGAGPLVIHSFRHEWNQSAVIYRGTDGPFEMVASKDSIATGAAISRIHSGGRFAFVSTICAEAEVVLSVQMHLVRLSQADSPERTIAWSDQVLPASGRGCAPYIGHNTVPVDAPAGDYELRRSVVASSGQRHFSPLTLPPVRIEIIP